GRTLITLGVPPVDRGRLPDFKREKRLFQHWEVVTGKLVLKVEVERPHAIGSRFPIVSGCARSCLDRGGGIGDDQASVFVWAAVPARAAERGTTTLNVGPPMTVSPVAYRLALERKIKTLSDTDLCLFVLPAGMLRRVTRREG